MSEREVPPRLTLSLSHLANYSLSSPLLFLILPFLFTLHRPPLRLLLLFNMLSSKFEPFEIIDMTFTVINDHPLDVTFLIPKVLSSKPSGEYPVLVNWHGGGFIIGHRIYEAWFSPWSVNFLPLPHYKQLSHKRNMNSQAPGSLPYHPIHSHYPRLPPPPRSQHRRNPVRC